jgi:hypothetical protein
MTIRSTPHHLAAHNNCKRNHNNQRGVVLALVLLAVFMIGLISYLLVGESDPKAAQSVEMQKTVGDIVNGIKAIQFKIDAHKDTNCWPNGGVCKDGANNSAAVPDNTLVKTTPYPYAGAAASGDSVVTCDAAAVPNVTACGSAGQKCGYAWQMNLCYRANNGVAKPLWDLRNESLPTVNNADLFISANGAYTDPLAVPGVVTVPAALTSGQKQQLSSLNGGSTKNQDIFQYRNKLDNTGVHSGVYIRILPADQNDVYTRRVLDAAAASLGTAGFKTQRCPASTGYNPGALMVSIYDASPTTTMCP